MGGPVTTPAPVTSPAPVTPPEDEITAFLKNAGIVGTLLAQTQQALQMEGVASVEDLEMLVEECGLPASIKTIPKLRIEKALSSGEMFL